MSTHINNDGLLQQLDSARADIQFLRVQHADTLKGLHNEISSLQQSNRDLQFQVTFSQPPECQIEKLENEIKALHLQTTRNERLHNEKLRCSEIRLEKEMEK